MYVEFNLFLFKLRFTNYQINRHCPKCKDFKDSAKKIDIWTMPNILIVHLKRFKFTKHKRAKIRSLIDFPLTGLDLSDCCARTQKDKPVYDLFAISVSRLLRVVLIS